MSRETLRISCLDEQEFANLLPQCVMREKFPQSSGSEGKDTYMPYKKALYKGRERYH